MKMIECSFCGEEIDESDFENDCPYCGETNYGNEFYSCPGCGEYVDYSGYEWECEHCQNTGITQRPNIMFDDDDDFYGEEYCEDGIPDVNQGWVGENYG